MTKREWQNRQWQFQRLAKMGFTPDECGTLRRASNTLRRWFERERGGADGDWAIERDETTGRPYNIHRGAGTPWSFGIPDRETGARERIAELCASRNVHYFIQSDPRGCALYVSRDAMTDSDYSTKGLAIY